MLSKGWETKVIYIPLGKPDATAKGVGQDVPTTGDKTYRANSFPTRS